MRIGLVEDQHAWLEQRDVGKDLAGLQDRGTSSVEGQARLAGPVEEDANRLVAALVELDTNLDSRKERLHVQLE